MKTYAILFGIILISGITFFMISSYSVYDKCIDCNPIHKDHHVVRCPPKKYKPNPKKISLNRYPKTDNISIYDDNSNINNKGFVNELMFRPSDHEADYQLYFNEITTPSMPLNEICENTTNLPIGNVNIHFLLKNKEAKLIV
jgi:hypothetical protein